MVLCGILAAVGTLQLLLAIPSLLHVEGKLGFGPGDQEWGYVTVRPYAKMFWWLYYTTSNDVVDARDKPLIIWLQGGPGGSSTGYGNFEELGPLDLDLELRNSSWVNDYNVLFIDNPVGTGYSYSDTFSGFAKDNAQIASDLLECIRGFLNDFPKFANVPTYITAESYGGKMAAEFALVWDRAQKLGDIKSNLSGVALGDSWISPIDSVLSWACFLVETGMVDTNGFDSINEAAQKTKLAIDNEEWTKATQLWSLTEGAIIKAAGNINFYNILYKSTWSQRSEESSAKDVTADRDVMLDKLMNGKVKEALKLNVTWGSQSGTVFSTLAGDFMKPATDIGAKFEATDILI